MVEPTARVLGMDELLNADAAGRSAKRAKDFIVTIVILILNLFDYLSTERRKAEQHAE